jgi:hypothetical protein
LNPTPRHKPTLAFVCHFVPEPGVDGIRSLRALLKIALRRLGLRTIDVRECALPAHHDERALAQQRSNPMSAFSDRIREELGGGLFKVADFESGPQTFTISHLLEAVRMFKKNVDLLCFRETERQFQINLSNAKWLIDNLGDDPEMWAGKCVTLYLASFEYEGETKQGIRLKLPGADDKPQRGDGSVQILPPRKADMDEGIPF